MTIEKHLSPIVFPNLSHFQTPLHSIFERIVQEKPAKKAVSFVGQSLTYQELNQKANQLAHWLIFKGIKAESRVGVCLKPGLEIIITLLAIQKAGGVYLPIDPDYPQARIKTIVEDAAVELTISQADLIAELSDVLINPYTLQQTQSTLEINRNDNPKVVINEQNTAYIFYTSGTTGMPKGIAISHKSFAYYVLAAIDQFGMTAQDRTVTIAKFSFSISLFDLMTSVISGGELIILPRAEIMNYDSLLNALETATIVHIGPNLLRGLIAYIKRNHQTYERFSGLRHVSSGGDIVPAELLEELKLIFEQAEIYVIYGCTEISCMGCCYLAPRNQKITKSYVGKPFAGTKIILLNDQGQEVPDGEIGEICFQGDGIMKGYLNRPELTSKALIKIKDATYFKTGDLGRIHTSGNLEYLGRQDFQIQIRGQRVELVEVESHLRQAPGVSDGVVKATEIGNQEKRLVAYITLENPDSFSLEQIRGYLHDRLPGYMQPSGWIVLEKMPLNVNYKIDRKALPAPTLSNLIITETYTAPRNQTEQLLTTIWQQVLDIPRVGINDNFFNIGGDSLSAMNISMLLAEKGIEFSPLQIAKTTTIADIVETGIRKYSPEQEPTSKLTKQEAGLIEDLPPLISRFLYERGSQAPHFWNISRMLVAKKPLSYELVEKTFYYLGDRHDALRLRFDPKLDLWQARTLATATETLSCKTVDLASLSEQEQNESIATAVKACQQELNLTNGAIACLVLFELGKERSQELFFVVHHFAMDVISWKIFWLEFESVYRQLEAQSDFTLSTSPVSFKTWAQTLREYANSSAVELDVRQWLNQPWQEVCSLPKDFRDEGNLQVGNLNTNNSTQVVSFTLTEWQTQTLMRSNAREFDLESILISGLATALGRWQKSELVYFDRLVHGRHIGNSDLDLSRTIGCLISYAPTLVKIDTQASTGNTLLDISQQMKEIGDSGTSIDLYRYLGAKPELVNRLAELPKAEVLFNYRGKVDDVLTRSLIFDNLRTIAGSDHDPKGLRQYPLAIAIDIVKCKLEVRCVYSQNIHKRESIKTLCAEFLNCLVSI